MPLTPASSHGGGTFPPANWTVDSDGNLIIAPPTSGGASNHIEQITTSELPADTVDTFRIVSASAGLIYAVDSSGEMELHVADAGSRGLRVQENQAGTTDLLRVNGTAGRAGTILVKFDVGDDALLHFGGCGFILGGTELNAAPDDADIDAGGFGFWLDKTNGAAKLMIKAKQADGTVKSAAIALA